MPAAPADRWIRPGSKAPSQRLPERPMRNHSGRSWARGSEPPSERPKLIPKSRHRSFFGGFRDWKDPLARDRPNLIRKRRPALTINATPRAIPEVLVSIRSKPRNLRISPLAGQAHERSTGHENGRGDRPRAPMIAQAGPARQGAAASLSSRSPGAECTAVRCRASGPTHSRSVVAASGHPRDPTSSPWFRPARLIP